MKVALAYDRVNKWGGAERVLLALHEMFPDAPLYTAVYNFDTAPWAKVFPKVIPSFLQKFPLAKTRHDLYGWLIPIAFEQFNFNDYDLVISVTSEAAKGIITKPGTRHICYCLTPTRYLWSGYDFYFRNPILRFFSKPVVSYLRFWDKVASQRPDEVIAISETVSDRIKRYYGREAKVVYPPVNTKRESKVKTSKELEENYFLVVSRLVPYKRVELVVRVFNRLKMPLVVVGKGSEEEKLKRMAEDNIVFMGEVEEDLLWQLYKGSRAVIFPQEEDFGIVAVEAQAFGKPVVAFRSGGATETVVEGKTGKLFNRQSEKSLTDAVQSFLAEDYAPHAIKKNAARFSLAHFKKEFAKLITSLS